jgi:hypothetical protein
MEITMTVQQTSKEQLKLKLKAKAYEAKAREEAVKSIHKSEVKEDDDTIISYDQWWMSLAKRAPVRPHLKEIFWANFKARGCTKNETSAKYYEMLDKFGYKLKS